MGSPVASSKASPRWPASLPPLPERERLWVLAACCVVAFARSVDPRLWMMGLEIPEAAFGAGWQDYRLFTTVTAVLLLAGMLVGGLLGDVFGRRRVMLGGALVSTFAGVLAMLAPSVPWFAVARIVDVGAGSIAFPLTLSVIRLTFTQRERPLALLVYNVVTGGALLVGLLAQVIEPLAGWRATLVMPAVAGAVGTLLTWRHVPESRSSGSALAQAVAAAAWALALLPLVLGVVQARLSGSWTNPVTLAALGVAGLGFLLLSRTWQGQVVKRATTGITERRRHALSVMLLAGAALSFGFSGYGLQVFGFLTVVQGLGGIVGGLALAPMLGAALVIGRRAAAMALSLDARRLIAGGLAIMGFAALVTSLVQPGVSYLLLVGPLFLFGLGYLVAQTAWSVAFMNAMPDAVVGTSAGIARATAAAGAALSIAVLGTALLTAGEADFALRLGALGLSPAQAVTANEVLVDLLRADAAGGDAPPAMTIAELGLLAVYHQSYTAGIAVTLRLTGLACLLMGLLAWLVLEPRPVTREPAALDR